MNNLSERQESILGFIKENKKASNREIGKYIRGKYGDISRYTILRDIGVLLKNKIVIKEGKGRSVAYTEANKHKLLKYINTEKYFDRPTDERSIMEGFNFGIFEELTDIFSNKEVKELTELNDRFRSSRKELSPTLLNKEIERVTIDLSWKSSQIEGNTYNILETEHLIKERAEAVGHSKEEATMILNHKEALDYIFQNKKVFKKITIHDIEDIHYLLTKNMGIGRNIRKRLVGITGTNYRPLDNEFQIKEALRNLCVLINKQKDILTRALIMNAMIAYIQPFEDGNKRTSRIMGTAILISNDYCPLSFRSINEQEYKKAVLLFYEQNNLRYFKELFVEQFRFAVGNYF